VRALEDTALYVLRAADFHEELDAWTATKTKAEEIVRNVPPIKWTEKTLQVLLEFARDTPFLHRHESTLQKKFLKAMRRREVKEGTILFHQREVAESFFILLDGQMSIHWEEGKCSRETIQYRRGSANLDVDEDLQRNDPRQIGVQLNILGPGATFGERSLHDRDDYPFTAKAETPCEMIQMKLQRFFMNTSRDSMHKRCSKPSQAIPQASTRYHNASMLWRFINTAISHQRQ
jgi:CRP-like cAMP-binding protein